MASTVSQVLPLALGAAVSPVLVLLQVATLASPRHALVRSLWVLLGATVVTAVVMAVVVVGDHATVSSGPGDGSVVGGWIRLALSVPLLAVGLRTLLTGRPGASPESHPEAPHDTDAVRPVRSLLLGVAAMATNVTTLVLLVPATHTTWTADLAARDRIVLLVVVGLITLLPAYLPTLGVVALGRRGPAVLAASSAWLHRHQRTITGAVALGFAVYLFGSGLRSVG